MGPARGLGGPLPPGLWWPDADEAKKGEREVGLRGGPGDALSTTLGTLVLSCACARLSSRSASLDAVAEHVVHGGDVVALVLAHTLRHRLPAHVHHALDVVQDGLVEGHRRAFSGHRLALPRQPVKEVEGGGVAGTALHRPGVPGDLLQREPPLRLDDEQAPKEVLALGGEEVGHAVLAPDDSRAQLLQRGAVEGEGAGHEDVEDDAQRPDVGLGPHVLLALEELGRGVGRAAAPRGEEVGLGEVVTEAKVCQLDVVFRVEEQVLCLEVSVDDAVRMAVLDGGEDLGEDSTRLVLAHPPVAHQKVEDLAVGRELCHDVDHALRLHHL